jgi:hypothetical protein
VAVDRDGDRGGGGDRDRGGGRDDSNSDDENDKTMKTTETVREAVDKRNWGLFCVSYCLFTRAVYRVFILWCEYPTRLFPFHAYKGHEKMGIRKMMT